jgi:hypothetical protein
MGGDKGGDESFESLNDVPGALGVTDEGASLRMLDELVRDRRFVLLPRGLSCSHCSSVSA